MAKQKMFYGASNIIFKNALSLRSNMTLAELLLWSYLKGNQLGAKFRRQHPLNNYIADFYCHKHNLIIELDGTIHSLPEIIASDIERQKNIEGLGLKVLRFSNNEVLKI